MNRIAILELSKFASCFGDRMRDELTDIQLAMLAYHADNRDDAEAGRLLREILSPHIEYVIDQLTTDTPDGEGPSCSLGYDSEDEESARLDRRDRARECK